MAETEPLPDGWRWARLGSVLESHRGGVWGAPSQIGSGYPVLRSTNMRNGRLNFSEVAWCEISENIAQSAVLEAGDILVSKSSGSPRLVGLPALFTGSPDGHSYLFSNFTMRLRPDPSHVRAEYLYRFLSGAKAESDRRNMAQDTAGLRNLKTREYLQQELPLPPLSEQDQIAKTIAELFAQSQTAREALERVPTLLKQFRQSVLAAAFRGELTERDASDEPAAELLKRIGDARRRSWEHALRAKDRDPQKANYDEPERIDSSALPQLPASWSWTTLPFLGELARGKSKHRPRDAQHLYGGSYPFIQTGDIARSNGRISQYVQTYSEAGLAQSRLWPKGTMCITIAANIADTAILEFDACFPDSVVGFRADENYCDIRFVEYFMRTAKDNLEQYAPATAQKNINLGILNSLAVPLPSLAEQRRIVEKVDGLFRQAEAIEKAVEIGQRRAEKVDQAILARAFRGQL
jgi:type I restriction enzyme, S subunit